MDDAKWNDFVKKRAMVRVRAKGPNTPMQKVKVKEGGKTAFSFNKKISGRGL